MKKPEKMGLNIEIILGVETKSRLTKIMRGLGLIGKLCYYRKIFFQFLSCMTKFSTPSLKTPKNSSLFSKPSLHLYTSPERSGREERCAADENVFSHKLRRWSETNDALLSSKSYLHDDIKNVGKCAAFRLLSHHTSTQCIVPNRLCIVISVCEVDLIFFAAAAIDEAFKIRQKRQRWSIY